MALADNVFKILIDVGENFASDLWSGYDPATLKDYASELAELEVQAQLAKSDEEKNEIARKVQRSLASLRTIGISRFNLAQKKLRDDLETAFITVALNCLAPSLGTAVAFVRDHMKKST